MHGGLNPFAPPGLVGLPCRGFHSNAKIGIQKNGMVKVLVLKARANLHLHSFQRGQRLLQLLPDLGGQLRHCGMVDQRQDSAGVHGFNIDHAVLVLANNHVARQQGAYLWICRNRLACQLGIAGPQNKVGRHLLTQLGPQRLLDINLGQNTKANLAQFFCNTLDGRFKIHGYRLAQHILAH